MGAYKDPVGAIESWIAEQAQDWLRSLAQKVLEVRRELTEQEVTEIYTLFLEEHLLVQKSETPGREGTDGSLPSEEPSAVAGRSSGSHEEAETTRAINKLEIMSLSDVRGVNAILPGQTIEFNPKLTVLFGYNASGKTGYVRVLKRVSNSKTAEDIWNNIHRKKEVNKCSARFEVNIDGEIRQLAWCGETALEPLSLVKVFDNKCVKVLLTEKLEFSFRPYGFELFSFVASAISRMRTKLMGEIEKRSGSRDFSAYFTESTEVFRLVEGLSADSDVEVVRRLATFDDSELRKLEQKKEGKKAIESTNLGDSIGLLGVAIRSAEKLHSSLVDASTLLGATRISELGTTVNAFETAIRSARERENTALGRYNIPCMETNEWEDFAQKAEKYIGVLPNPGSYPDDGDSCIYCRQNLSQEALELLRLYRRLSAGRESVELKRLRRSIEDTTVSLQEKSYMVESHDLGSVKGALDQVEVGLCERARNALCWAEESRQQMLSNLRNTKWIDLRGSFDENIVGKVAEATVRLKRQRDLLLGQKKERENRIAELSEEISELEDRRKLSEKQGEIIAYLEQVKWVDTAERASNVLNTRPVTVLSKSVWDRIVTDEFKAKFERERADLEAPKIDFQFPGEYGKTKREKSIEGLLNIDDFLSEGEQKAIALADFFAELSLANNAFPVVFDDPIVSFDHKRMDKIAKRLVEESGKRQVIVFTHDILLVKRLREYSMEAVFHWIERDDGLCGRLSANDHPMLDSYEHKLKKVREAIGRARQLAGSERETEIMTGFSFLRTAYENFVVEKVFRRVISRCDDNVRVSRLRQVRFDQDKLEVICRKYDELSGFITSHSQSDMTRQAPPSVDDLDRELRFLEALEYG